METLKQLSQEPPRCNLKSAPTHGREGPKKEAGHSGLQVAVLISKGNSHRRLALGGGKVNGSPHLPRQILKVYLEALIRCSHVDRAGVLNTTWWSLCSRSSLWERERQAEVVFPGPGRRQGASGSSLGASGQSYISL